MTGVTTGNCLPSQAHMKEQLWMGKGLKPWFGSGGFWVLLWAFFFVVVIVFPAIVRIQKIKC